MKSKNRKKLKLLEKDIFNHIISAVFFTLLFAALAVVITMNYIATNIQKVYVDNGFMIQINPKISKELDIISDVEGLNTKTSSVNITNNNTTEKKYQLVLTPLNDNENDIRIALDNVFVRSLSKFKKEDNSYILTEYILPPQQTKIHNVKMWQDKKVQDKKINVNFSLEVKITDKSLSINAKLLSSIKVKYILPIDATKISIILIFFIINLPYFYLIDTIESFSDFISCCMYIFNIF